MRPFLLIIGGFFTGAFLGMYFGSVKVNSKTKPTMEVTVKNGVSDTSYVYKYGEWHSN